MPKIAERFRFPFVPISGGSNWCMAFGVALVAPACVLMLPLIFPDERDPHGGMYAFAAGACLLVFAMLLFGIGLVWGFLKRRRE